MTPCPHCAALRAERDWWHADAMAGLERTRALAEALRQIREEWDIAQRTMTPAQAGFMASIATRALAAHDASRAAPACRCGWIPNSITAVHQRDCPARGGEPSAGPRETLVCSFYGCNETSRYSGMCKKHYDQMVERRGEP